MKNAKRVSGSAALALRLLAMTQFPTAVTLVARLAQSDNGMQM